MSPSRCQTRRSGFCSSTSCGPDEAAFGIAKRFYPLLRRNRSVLIHQDFVYPFYPWVIIQMGLMDRYFRVAYNIPYSSMVFDVISTIPPDSVPDAREVTCEVGRTQDEKFLPHVEGWGKGALLQGRALYTASKGRVDQARRELDEVEATYSSEPLAAQ